MIHSDCLPRAYFDRPALTVARDLLGTRLVRLENGRRLSGVIVETEAYSGEDDLGCHAKAGRTPRTEVMYGPPGHAYVYFTYGMHWCLNFVVQPAGYPAAVLIRAIEPLEGLDVIAARREGVPRAHWTDGPAKLTKALNIAKAFNGEDLCGSGVQLFVTPGVHFLDSQISVTPRIGLKNVPEPWKSILWRFQVAGRWDVTQALPMG
jgi:DNA-3-methyladenine glycosylase